MPYEEYLRRTNQPDDRHSWIAWKMEIWGMDFVEARKASVDPDWGYESIMEK